MKRTLLAIFFATLVLSGCGAGSGSPESGGGQSEAETVTNNTPADTVTDSALATTAGDDSETPEPTAPPLTVAVNTTAEEVYYYGNRSDEIFYSPVSDGENLYLKYDAYIFDDSGQIIGQDSALYVMAVGSDETKRVGLPIPEGAYVGGLAVDLYGQLYVLITNRENRKHFIWLIDENLQIEDTIDISEYAPDSRMPSHFFLDKEGRYFIQWHRVANAPGLILDSSGALLHSFGSDSLGIDYVNTAGVGRDGEIYIIHGDYDDRWDIARVDMENGSIENINTAIYFPGGELLTALAPGTDTNLLLCSRYSGVWAYDTDNGVMENRVPLVEIGIELGEISVSFLPDGRLLLITSYTEDGSLLFKYVPAGK